MEIRNIGRALSLLLLFGCKQSLAYDAETHGMIMRMAYARSNLVLSQDTLKTLGLDRFNPESPFGAYWLDQPGDPSYFDDLPTLGSSQLLGDLIPTARSAKRAPTEYEHCQMTNLSNAGLMTVDETDKFPIQNWLIRGVLREDDLGPVFDYVTHTDCLGVNADPSPWEDGWQPRVFNHFYDPIRNMGLNGIFEKSVDWALGYVDSFVANPVYDATRANHFSYVDARQNMWLALTAERGRSSQEPWYSDSSRKADAIERTYRWATTFRALGDVIHLLQDGAQPQHVRNDAHSPDVSSERQAFESYTNARVLGSLLNNELLQPYVYGLFRSDEGVPIPRIPLGNYVAPMFSTPLKFYTTRNAGDSPSESPDNRFGLIDYANRSFFTGGTLPGACCFQYGSPNPIIDEDTGYTKSELPCKMSSQVTSRLQVLCTHWTSKVYDSVHPGYVDELPSVDGQPSLFSEPPLVTESVLSSLTDVVGNPVFPPYALGIEELQTTANLAIPRAVSYSTGMINYFFRGKIVLSSPPDGLYSVVDQGVDHTVVDGVPIVVGGTGQIFGFTTLRVRAKNATADINEPTGAAGATAVVHQTMHSNSGGPRAQLVAIARYHRNPCYEPDLSGEYIKKPDGSMSIPGGCSLSEARTSVPEISVSAPLTIDDDGKLSGINNGSNSCANVGNINTGTTDVGCVNGSALLEFDFSSDAIPVNATDLFIQVAYRGPLGMEQDGIAVGSIDINEPNFYSMWNNTDWIYFHTVWYAPWQVPPSGYMAAGDSASADLCFENQRIARLGAGQVLRAGWDFMRIGVLTDLDPHRAGSKQSLQGGFSASFKSSPIRGKIRQATTEEGAQYAPEPMTFVRGITAGVLGTFVYFYTPDPDTTGGYLNLSPLLPAPRGVGLANKGLLQFTSAPDHPCDQIP